MPKRTGNRRTAKSNIYSPDIESEFSVADLPTPVVSPPLSLSEVPPLVEFSPEPLPEFALVDRRHDWTVDDRHDVSPALDADSPDRPLSPLLFQDSEPPGDVLSFAPVEDEEQHAAVADVQTGHGHTRSPVLAREPTMLENFSRTVRNFVPSSIPIPTAAPSPPRVSRPVSFGSFMTPTSTGPTRLPTGSGGGGGADVHEYGYGARGSRQGRGPDYDYLVNRKNAVGADREQQDYGRIPWARDYREGSGMEEDEEGWRFGRGLRESSQLPFALRSYPSQQCDEGDDIFWARWDVLGCDAGVAQQRRLLFLGYASGLQIWDCTDLAKVSEVLNLPGLDWGYVSCASILSRPQLTDTRGDPLTADHPLIGIIATLRHESTFIVYSLHRHHVVKRLPLLCPATFSANKQFISTINSPTLHILSPVTFATLYTISPAFLASTPSAINRTNNAIVSSSEIETDHNLHGFRKAPLGEPIYALSGRLLAYASPTPYPSASANTSSLRPQTQSQSHNRSPSGGFSMHITQADISNVAMKVGGTVLSGMKSLGEMAYSAALARAGFAMESGSGSAPKSMTGPRGEEAGSTRMGGVGRFFSRSAPAAANDHHERRYPTPSTSPNLNPDPDHEYGHGQSEDNRRNEAGGSSLPETHVPDVVLHAAPSSAAIAAQAGHYVTVLDLAPLLLGGSGAARSTPRKVAEFMVSKNRSIGRITFSRDGNSIAVAPRDGQVSQVFQLRPTPMVNKSNALELDGRSGVESDSSTGRQDAPWHMYDLRRGRTNAVIEGVDWAEDGRWIAIGTRNRTIHIFAVNPYGGRPDQRSHIEGRVRNYTQLPLSIEVHPIVRLRSSTPSVPQKAGIPLAFTFIESSESSLPVTLLPPPTMPPSGGSGPSSLPKSDAGPSEPATPHRRHRPTNFQDILVFDPAEGMLSLRRIFVELRPQDQRISVPSSVTMLGATSTSLPGTGGAGRLGISPPSASVKVAGAISGQMQNSDPSMELVGKESVVATWSLQRHQDWKEIKRVLDEPRKGTSTVQQTQTPKPDVLAHAELSTCSTSPRVLPRSIYLSHQFSFHTLGEDYHALIRRYQLDISGSEIEVRKKVQVSAYGAGVGESFLEGYSASRDIRRPGSSFDEPLASALSGGLDYSPTTPILPMLPNGMPGSHPISFRNSIPIRKMAGLSDGMTEGIGRIRREIHKARSPPAVFAAAPKVAEADSATVPLEFDEEDEDFLGGEVGMGMRDDKTNSRTTSGGGGSSHGGDSGASVSTPSTNFLPLEGEYESDDLWQGWDPEDKKAIEDAERFDHISVVGFLDEEHASIVKAERRRDRRRGK